MTYHRPRPRRSTIEKRATYARTGLSFDTNSPDGFPSAYPPNGMWWVGTDQWPGILQDHGNAEVLPAVTRLTGIITDPLSTVPWKHVEQTFGGDVLTTPRWLTDPQLLRADSRIGEQVLPCVLRLPRAEFWSSWIRTAVWHGSSALIYNEDLDGQPQAGTLRTLHPQFVRTVRDDTGTLVWEIGEQGGEAIRSDRDGYFTVGAITWRIVVLRDPHAPVDVDGRSIGVFERHTSTFGLGHEIEAYLGSVYKGNGVPNGILKVQQPGLTQEQATALKSSWMNAHGDRKSIAVLNATTEFQALSITPQDAQVVESARANMASMCLAFALDPSGALGISMGNSATYANVQQYFARLKTDLMPWITAVEEVVSALLPSGRGVRMDFSEFTRPDPLAQYQALQIAVEAGLMTLNEARNVLGLPALPEPPPQPEPAPPPPEPPAEPPAEPVRSRTAPTWLRGHEM